ncbi:MAG: autotransporter outer membrane beta-barrel domain-containing protein [Pseudomonadota bacterium]
MHDGNDSSPCTATFLSALCGLVSDGYLAAPIRPGDEAEHGQTTDTSAFLNGYAPADDAAGVVPVADFRFEGRLKSEYVHYEADTYSGGIWTHEAGIDYIWNEQLLIGIVGRYDTGEVDITTPINTPGTFLGEGVTLGLRAGTLLGFGMTLDGNISHTWLEYESVAGLFSGATQASRLDASINLAGAYDIGDQVSIEPNVRYSYTREAQDAFRFLSGVPVARSVTSAGAIGAGTLLRYTSEQTDGSSWSVYASAHADYDFALMKGTSSTPFQSLDDIWSARLGLGGYGSFANGITVYLEGEADRLGADAYTRYTGTARVSVPLN